MHTFATDIDHTDILPADLAIALANAEHDPDGQVFPWQALYPLAGQTVYADGQLWTVLAKERGPMAESPLAAVQLVPQTRDLVRGLEAGVAIMTRCECRPVTWTQDREDAWAELEAAALQLRMEPQS